MAKNPQVENATKLMWRNNASEICMAIGISHADRRVTLNNYWDGVTAGAQNTGIGIVGNTARAFRFELPSTASNQVGRGRAQSWSTYSSRRWKENINRINNGLSIVAKLHPSEFDWKPEHGGNHDTSFIAEELAEVIPHAVCYDDDGQAGSIDATRIIPYLVSAVQQQQAQIEALTKQIELLSSNTEGL